MESENHNSEITEQQLCYLNPKAIMCVAQHVILYFAVTMEYFSYLLPGPTPWLASNGGGLLLFGMTQNTQPPFQASALMHSTPKFLSVPHQHLFLSATHHCMLGEWDSHCYSPSIAEQMTALCYSGRQQQVSVLVSIPWVFVFTSEYLANT